MLKKRIKNKEKLIGMYVHFSDLSISRIAGLCGYDYVWVDMEHSYLNTETLMGHIYALRTTGAHVIVRAPQDDLTFTKKILEMGVDGIIFPMVKTPEEINRIVSYSLYPPKGTRGFGPMGAIDFGFKPAFEYTKNDEENLCRFIQIEDKATIENLDEIMKNPYIDGYIFGPNDLSASYGMLGEAFSDKITEVISEAIKKLHANGKYVAIASGGCSEEVISHWSKFGADMICAGADVDFMREGARRNKENLDRIFKGKG